MHNGQRGLVDPKIACVLVLILLVLLMTDQTYCQQGWSRVMAGKLDLLHQLNQIQNL